MPRRIWNESPLSSSESPHLTVRDEEDLPFLSYAQNFEDVVLWRALGDCPAGFYVDVGAADPVVDSITAAFYERGWSGVNVEPVPSYAEALRSSRPRDVTVQAGAGDVAGMAVLRVVDGTGWSTFESVLPAGFDPCSGTVREIEVPVATLDTILRDCDLTGREIHFLKVDVEGFEAKVLAGADLAAWKPWVLVVEATAPGSTEQTHGDWEGLVIDAGYQFCLFDGLNRFYAHEEHADLSARLSYPACTFDQPFEQRHHGELRRQLRESRAQVGRREDEIKRRIAESGVEVDRREQEIRRLITRIEHLAGAFAENVGLRYANLSLRAQHAEFGRVLHIERMARGDLELVFHDLEHAYRDLERAYSDAIGGTRALKAEVDAVRSTLSWRITTPLRKVRRPGRGEPTTSHDFGRSPVAISASSERATFGTLESAVPDASASGPAPDFVGSFLARISQVTGLIADGHALEPSADTLTSLQEAIDFRVVSDLAVSWLGYLAATGRYPDEDSVRATAAILRRAGSRGFVDHLAELFERSLQEGRGSDAALDVISGGVVVDVTHTAQHDLQTGIQRVVRETCSRWLSKSDVIAVWWDYAAGALRRLDDEEVERFGNWRAHLPTTHGTDLTIRSLDHGTAAVVVPWNSILLLPELTAEPARTGGFRALSCAGVIKGISMIGYDMIPVTAAETVTEAMSHVFSLYLSMVKHASRLSAISGAAAVDFQGFNAALASQGFAGPTVRPHLLPPSPTHVSEEDIEAARASLGVGALPVVLVVGSHEPRKNHLLVLEAAERLWARGEWFDLVFIGGSGWRSELFDAEVERLAAAGRPILVRKRATETELWSAYRLSRFSVFPSLLEGFGLPIVESMASGTPVITTFYGSMAEIATGGGALLIDPYDVTALETAMHSLLIDDDLHERLRREASERVWPTWDQYASDVWDFLTGDVA